MFKRKKKQDKKKEACPLCKISNQTLERLKESGNKKTKDRLIENNDESRNRK